MQMQKLAFALLLATCGAAFQRSHATSKKAKGAGFQFVAPLPLDQVRAPL